MDTIKTIIFGALSSPDSDSSPKTNETVSAVLGSISLTAWICLLIPQLLQNYRSKNADGLSMGFLFIWLTGDIANLSGALWSNLAPTAITLGSYFCCADLVLISQCLYYNTLNSRRARRREQQLDEEEEESNRSRSEERPLLQRRRSSSIGLPGSHRRPITHEESALDPLTRMVTGEDETPDSRPWLHNTLSLVAVYVVGIVGWFVSDRFGATAAPDSSKEPQTQDVAVIGMVLGYFSALCYLCARLPQIYKNYQEKSCEGLALLFFLLSITGNMTYGLSLLTYSVKPADLLRALPWLLGSLGTIVEDSIIFVQFRLYAPRKEIKVSETPA